MACDGDFAQNSIQIWSRVPGGSTLVVAVETTSTALTTGARVLIDEADGSNGEQQVADAQLRPGPHRLTLQAGATYDVRLRVGFTGAQAEAVIDARIEKPGGQVHGLPYRFCVHGKNGDEGRATLTIATRRT